MLSGSMVIAKSRIGETKIMVNVKSKCENFII